jgi:hypothetical protein
VEESCLVLVIIPAFAWMRWGKLQKPQSGQPVSGSKFETGILEYEGGVLLGRGELSIRKERDCPILRSYYARLQRMRIESLHI